MHFRSQIFSHSLAANLQVNKEECESRKKVERERLVAEQKSRRSAVLTEWERTWSPPQSEEVC